MNIHWMKLYTPKTDFCVILTISDIFLQSDNNTGVY